MAKTIVTVEINNESDLYCPYNRDHEIKDTIASYIVQKVLENKKKKDDIAIRIVSDEPVDEDSVREAFKQWSAAECTRIKKETRIKIIQLIWMLGIGIGFVALSLALKPYVNNILFTVISTIGAFAIWESASIWIIDSPALRLRSRMFKKWFDELELIFENRA